MSDTQLKRRVEREPPPQWWAELLAALRARFPQADLRAPAVAPLYSHFREQWRRGQTVREAAQTASSCSGQKIQVEAAPAAVRSVRPPAGAQAGQAFGVEALREPARLARLHHEQARLQSLLTAARAKRTARQARGKDAPSERTREAELTQSLAEVQRQIETAQAPARPRAARRPAAPGCPATEPACKLGLLGGVCGLPAPLVLAAAQGAPVVRSARYCLTSAFRLKPSHVPHRGFAQNPSYPAGVQERPYHLEKPEQLKVHGIAQNLIPELVFNGAPGAIDGLPVVTADGLVLGGNGRTMALQLHYGQGGQVAREYLLGHARQFGFTRAQVAAIADPVVVRVVETSPPEDLGRKRELQELVRLLNVPLLQGLSARSESIAEAKRLSDEVLDVLSVALPEDVTLAEYLSSPASRTLIGALRRSGAVTDRNAGRLLVRTGDSFSEEGKRFVERLLLAALIPHEETLDHLDGRIREALARSAPYWLSAAAGGPDWDLRPALAAAARDLIAVRAADTSVQAYLRQGQLGGGAPNVAGVPQGEAVLQLLDSAGTRPTALVKVARAYAASSRLHPSAQGSLLAEEKLSPAQALARAARNT